VSFSYQKQNRLLKKDDFKKVLLNSFSSRGAFLKINYCFGTSNVPKLGLIVTRRFGNSVRRNNFKRKIREIFRTNKLFLRSNLEVIVLPQKAAKEASHQELCRDFLSLIPSISLQ